MLEELVSSGVRAGAPSITRGQPRGEGVLFQPGFVTRWLSYLLAALQNVNILQGWDLGSHLKRVRSNVGNLGPPKPRA